MSGIAEQKKAARVAAFARRKLAHGDSVQANRAATARLLDFISGLDDVTIVSGYLPIRTEIDPLPAMKALIGRGRRICVPVVRAAGQPLDFREWTPGAALKDAPFGVQVPVEGMPLQPDILIVPLAAFDKKCYRLGYGGGFYDRTLADLRAERRVVAVGIAYEGQFCENVPVGPDDQVLDGIVTECSLYLPH